MCLIVLYPNNDVNTILLLSLYKYNGCDIFLVLLCHCVAVDWEGWVNYIMCEYLCAQEMAPAHKCSGGRIILMTIIIQKTSTALQ